MRRLIVWMVSAFMLLAFGAGIGLGISWGVVPVKMTNTAPETLRRENKDRYRILIAEDFLVTGDRARAEARLELLDGSDPLRSITDQIDRNAWASETERDALAALQTALAVPVALELPTKISSPMSILGAVSTTERTNTLTPILSTTSTPGKTLTPLKTPNAGSFIILNRTPVCDSVQNFPTLQVNVVDTDGKPLSGVVLIISSVEGSERVITGLKAGASPGGADFTLAAGMVYTITLENGLGISETVTTAQCTSTNGALFQGGWKLLIQY